MHGHHSINKQRKCSAFSRKADMPGLTVIVGMVLALLLLIFLIWLALRSGRAGVEVISELP